MRTKTLRTLSAILALFAAHVWAPDVSAQSTGHFTGELVATLLPDGRNMQLVKPFGYTDTKGQNWNVPAGEQTDGASIPRAFWVSHPPFTGKYRAAAVIHDYYCRTQTRSWKDTHNVFYEAMRTAGVDDRTAKMMWGAVYRFGPRWDDGGGKRSPSPALRLDVAKQAEFMRDLDAWIARSNPARDEIAQAIDSGSVPR